MKDAEANEQHKSIISALKVAALELEFEQINFVVGNRGLVVESFLLSPKLPLCLKVIRCYCSVTQSLWPISGFP